MRHRDTIGQGTLPRGMQTIFLAWLCMAPCATASAQEILEKGSKPGNVRIEMVNVPVGRVAEGLVRVGGLKIEGLEKLGSTLITLRFQDIPAHTLVPILAEVAELESRRRADGIWRVARHANHDAMVATRAEAQRAREAKDTAALEKSLRRLLDLSPSSGPEGVDALPGPEVDELTSILERREDLAAAEAVQRRWLALVERNDVKEEIAQVLLKIARYAGQRNDTAAARHLYERALGMAGHGGVHHSVGTRARVGLAAVAVKEGRIDAAEDLQAKALGELKQDDLGDIIAIHEMHATSGSILLHALDTNDYPRRERVLLQRLALYDRTGDTFSMDERLFDLNMLGYTRLSMDQLPAARAAFADAISLAERAALQGHAEYPEALRQRAKIDIVLGRYAEARDGYRKFCGLRHAVFGQDHPATRATLAELAALEDLAANASLPPRTVACPPATPKPKVSSPRYDSMLEGNVFSDAGLFLSAYIDAAKAAVPAKPVELAQLHERHALTLLAQGTRHRLRAAGDLTEALRLRNTHLGASHADTRRTAALLANLYDALQFPDKARDIRMRWP
ncbi:MAG: hypothetical protein JNK75_12115 [Betaproteobacteria bacterium]|nr:hypothetical protein [Betaproteobacteria bacterium]